MARSIVSCGHDDDTGEAFLFASVVRFPDRHDRNRSCGWFRFCRPARRGWPLYWFAVVMAQVRRPVPFRTRKLRPGRGDGTALERVWESSTPPHSFVGVPVERDAPGTPFFVFRFPGDPRARRSGNPFSYSRTRAFPPPIGGFWTPEGLPAGGFLHRLEVSGRREARGRADSSTHWVFCSAGRPGGGRIAPVTGSPGTLGDPRNFRGASCPYPMVE